MSEQIPSKTCLMGGGDDGTLRVCCSTHKATLCAHHYARSHFVETDPAYDGLPCKTWFCSQGHEHELRVLARRCDAVWHAAHPQDLTMDDVR